MTASLLYPEIEPYRTGYLNVGGGHEIYFEESGNPKGQPALFLHGGPGSGARAKHRRLFDPTHYRIVIFDQRGAGRSRPSGRLEENTTWHLVDDIEKLRRQLGISKWLVYGGSWGSTLGLAYAEAHPEAVSHLVLRGIYLGRRAELVWTFGKNGVAQIYPDAYEKMATFIPEEERHDLVHAYFQRLTSADPMVRKRTTAVWTEFEDATAQLVPPPAVSADIDDIAIQRATIEFHYFVNDCFLRKDDQLLSDIPRIRHIPAVIVQGRYDMITPFQSAWDLHKAWPEATLKVVSDAGHSGDEPGTTKATVEVIDRFRE